MLKAFLSHSSKDKKSYVELIAKYLGEDKVVYDEFTFEIGERSLDEILKNLLETELFVIFISENSLQSDWVRLEITEANIKYDQGLIKKIYPIIIDDNITYEDPRIPAWLTAYNLKSIKRPKIIAKRIYQKLQELSWEKHPTLAIKENLFIGRNEKLEEFEERIHSFDIDKPIAIILSGFIGVGRRTFLRNALIKTSVISQSYKPSIIYLDRSVSIEDFMLKLNDLGFVDFGNEVLNLSDKSIEIKIDMINKIMYEAYKAKEIIFILDDGCLINYKREVTEWFTTLILKFKFCNYPIFCCISKYQVPYFKRPQDNKFYFQELSELNMNERKRFFSTLLEIDKIDLLKKDFEGICNLFTGFPDQVTYATNLLKYSNNIPLIEKFPLISAYSTDKAASLLKKYDTNEHALDFIRLLAQFEIITKEFIFSIVREDEYSSILQELVSEHICDLLGTYGEMIRLNDIVRDYIKRNRLAIKEEFNQKIKRNVTDIIRSENLYERDSSEYIFSIKEALMAGKDIKEEFLIPSHYLRCMKDLYYESAQMDKIIKLADIILPKASNIDFNLIQDIRYYLCLALSKKQNKRLLTEVQKVTGDEHIFLLGFYYRQCGRLKDALEQFKQIIDKPYVDARAKREMVQVYVQLEDYDAALNYAKKNYAENIGNQFHTQAYFSCLINSDNYYAHKEILAKLINNLLDIGSLQATEMAQIAKSLYTAKILNDKPSAIDIINDCITQNPNKHYPILAKCDIAIKYKDSALLEEGINELHKVIYSKGLSERALVKYQAFLEALKGNLTQALHLIDDVTVRYPEKNKEKMRAIVYDLSKKEE